jgi:hypothetical protein
MHGNGPFWLTVFGGQATMFKPARCSLSAGTAHQSSMQRSATSFANSRYFRPVRPKETSIHKWDQQFESAFLQHGVRCEPCDLGGQRQGFCPRLRSATWVTDRNLSYQESWPGAFQPHFFIT